MATRQQLKERKDNDIYMQQWEAAQDLVRTGHEFLKQSKLNAFSPETTQAWNEYQKARKRYKRLAKP